MTLWATKTSCNSNLLEMMRRVLLLLTHLRLMCRSLHDLPIPQEICLLEDQLLQPLLWQIVKFSLKGKRFRSNRLSQTTEISSFTHSN